MEYTIKEIKSLYRTSPAKVYEKLKAGARLYADDDGLSELLRILLICKIAYQLKIGNSEGAYIHEIVINED